MAKMGRQQMQGKGPAFAFITPGGDVTGGLVDRRVSKDQVQLDALALEPHLVFVGVYLGTQLSDYLAVYLDEACGYQGLGSPATRDPRLLQYFLQP